MAATWQPADVPVLALPRFGRGSACRSRRTRGTRPPPRPGALRVDRGAAAGERPRHLHDHQRLDHAARGAGGHGRGLAALRAPRRADRGHRRAARRADEGRVGPRDLGVRGCPHARHGSLRGRGQRRPPRAPSRPARLSQGRGHHPEALAQRLRRGGARGGRAGDRGGDRGRARGRLRAAHGDGLHLRRPQGRRGTAEHEGHLRGREAQGRARPGGRGRRGPHRTQHPPAGRGRPRGLQRREVHARAAKRWPPPRAQGSRARRLGAQRAASRLRACDQGRQGRSHGHAHGRGDVGEARPQGRVEPVARLARSREQARPCGARRDHEGRAARGALEPHARP